MNTATKIIVSIGSIAVIATAGIGGFVLATSNSTSTPSIVGTVSQTTTPSTVSTTTSANSSTTSGSSTSTTSGYKDGTYTASTAYSVPHGASNSISATVTVSGGSITAVTTNNNYSDDESGMYIDSFKSSVNSAAVGSSLVSANFSRIGGASLTTRAFDAVLDQIRTQATA